MHESLGEKNCSQCKQINDKIQINYTEVNFHGIGFDKHSWQHFLNLAENMDVSRSFYAPIAFVVHRMHSQIHENCDSNAWMKPEYSIFGIYTST